MNIIINKFKEIFLSPQTKISGKWNISIIHKNGEEQFVFGKKYKPNLILNQGLDILASAKYYTEYNGRNWNTIPAFLFGGAQCGIGNSISNDDTSLSNFFKYTDSINDDSCEIVDNIITGTRTFKKVYDFPELNENERDILIREIGLTTPWGKENDEEKLFAKFILPEAIRLMPEQFIRLYYEFSISSPNIINPINIQINPAPTSPNFNPNGSILLAGRFADIFGSFNSNGFMRIEFGDSPRGSFLPYWDEFCLSPDDPECLLTCFGTSYLIEDIYANISVNQPIISQWIGQRTSQKNLTINASNYMAGNYYRDITYIFDQNNPIENSDINAFLFTVTRSDRENTIDGWFWEFNQKQTKFIDKKLVIMLRQSVSR